MAAYISRGHKIADCIRLLMHLYEDFDLDEDVHVSPEGFELAYNYYAGIRLQANHITGKDINLGNNPGLKSFLEGLATCGVGYMKKYEEVEYEFLDVYEEE